MARRSTPIALAFVAALLGMAAAGAVLWLRTGRGAAPPGTPTPEERGYFSQIEITGTRMSAAHNFLGDIVVYLDAQVVNRGPRVVRRLDVNLEFADTLGQVVLRDAARLVSARTPPLKPGESRAIHLAFEHVPVDWNQAPPAVTPSFVGF